MERNTVESKHRAISPLRMCRKKKKTGCLTKYLKARDKL